MKIGIVVWNLDLTGGTERQALELAIHLKRMGHHVEVYCAYYDPERCFPEFIREFENIRYLEACHRVEITHRSRAVFYWDILFRRSRALSKMISPDLDVLNCHEYTTFLSGVMYKKRTGVPVVGMLNDTPSFEGVYEPKDGPYKFPLSWAKRAVFAPAIKAIDTVVVLDHLNRNRLKKYLGLDATVVRSGADLAKYMFQERTLHIDRINILANGNFFPWRRYEDLISALRILADEGVAFHLNHIGTDAFSPAYAARIRRLVARLGLVESVTFRGYVSEPLLLEIYSHSDIFVFPNFPQTWGLAVFEAMACGIPVIVNSGCGAAEVLADNETAIVVPPESPGDIARAILRLRDSPELFNKLSKNGRAFVEENISWELYASNMLETFSQSLTSRRGERRNRSRTVG